MPFKYFVIIDSPYLPFKIPTQCKAASLTPLSLSSTVFIIRGNISSEILYNTSIYVINAAFSKNLIVPNLTKGAAFVNPIIISSFICSRSVHYNEASKNAFTLSITTYFFSLNFKRTGFIKFLMYGWKSFFSPIAKCMLASIADAVIFTWVALTSFFKNCERFSKFPCLIFTFLEAFIKSTSF